MSKECVYARRTLKGLVADLRIDVIDRSRYSSISMLVAYGGVTFLCSKMSRSYVYIKNKGKMKKNLIVSDCVLSQVALWGKGML